MNLTSLDDPHERCARADARAELTIHHLDPGDPLLRAGLAEWERLARALLGEGELGAETRPRIEDDLRIIEELRNVLDGVEPGEGTARERELCAAFGHGRLQGVCSYFVCPGGVFIELLASAPWNLLRAPGGPDRRAVRGVGQALIAHAQRLSFSAGHGGRVSLQAENPRCLQQYRRLGFELMRPSDVPLTLVPKGKKGWSKEALRVARGQCGPEEARAPWLLLDPSRHVLGVRRAQARGPGRIRAAA
ncbi:N-acetyltransferase [Anaeromyxobacter diazotrophicus]|uniref:N-acetyltransferase domain-containing protein n=1 Tax=Anaeromyxobacter diazotrophicus TaxID=2590199 RepID=A0A7I9VP38_9BACT|nr:N-acetyltransferase [Anaeromyxobacter diazotrophicus]GEJ58176.1 hypothetical protein AMYX_29170 [Anaeromyxobacter diazotrophicus]